jgi:hypothetical protein
VRLIRRARATRPFSPPLAGRGSASSRGSGRAIRDPALVLELAASPTLAAQVRTGARIDVLATADERTMADAWRAGFVERPAALATIDSSSSRRPGSGGIRGVEDLARPGA